MSTAVADSNPFQNTVKTISVVNSFHPSATQRKVDYLNVELDVEKNLQAAVAKDRIRIKEFFQDFDKLRKGVVGEAAFRTCLGSLNFRFSDAEINQLLNKYKMQNGLVNYADFCSNIDSVFSDTSDVKTTIDQSKSRATFTEAEQQTLINLLTAVREQVATRRILIKPQFQDFDKSKSCHITVEQFRRVLKDIKLLPPSEDLFQLMIRKYFDKSNIREINYVAFCADIDKPEDLFKAYSPKNQKDEAPVLHGRLRDAGSTFFAGSTANIDIIENRFQQQRIDLSKDPNDIETRLQAAIVMKRVRIEEFFHDFDKLRKGKVTQHQFQSILSMLNFNLSREEFDALAERYKTNDPEQMFCYKDFVANINSAFTTYGIQKMPLTKVAPVTVENTVPARRKYLEMTPEQQETITAVLKDYAQAIQIRRFNIKQMCQDFDITRNNHITKHQFLRILTQLGLTTSQETLNLLLRFYCDKGNADEVNYFDFCNDVDSPEQLFGVGRGYNHSFDYYPKNRPRVTGVDIKKDCPNDVEDVLAKLRVVCKEQRIRISEFFRDFDKLRKGHITAAQFRIGLNMAKIVLSSHEFNTLQSHYQGADAQQVRWRDFSDDIDLVFTKKGLEQQCVDTVVDDARTVSYYGRSDPDAIDFANVEALENAFKELIQRERLDAKSFFQDQDRHNHFKVSAKKFKQIITFFKVAFTDSQIDSMVKVYGNANGEIDYLAFLDKCNVLHYHINEPYTGTKSTYKANNPKFVGTQNVSELMDKIKELVKRNRIRVGEFFLDHDGLRKGTIDATKFRTTLYAQKLQLTREEYTLLEEHYRDPENPTKVRYVDFNEEIEKIFTEKDLEKNPTKTLGTFTVTSILEARNQLSAEEEAELHTTMTRLGTDVRNRRLLLKPFFQDKDKSKSGFVSNTRFRSIFDSQKLWITDREYYLINRRFKAGADNEINYVEFDHVLRHYSGDRE